VRGTLAVVDETRPFEQMTVTQDEVDQFRHSAVFVFATVAERDAFFQDVEGGVREGDAAFVEQTGQMNVYDGGWRPVGT
jgi:hypothetical protein